MLFLCVSNRQRPYRVVEVPAARLHAPEDLERLPEGELRELYDASRSLDFPRTYAG